MITSTGNPRIKAIRALRSRKEREYSGIFFVEGIRLVAEALQLQVDVETLVVAPELLASEFARELVADARGSSVPVLEVSRQVFESMSSKEGPQGIAAVVRQVWEPLPSVRLEGTDSWVALHSVQDPGNVGTILRTCDAVGSAGLILLDHSTDPYDPAAIRASMGSIFSRRLVRASFDEFVQWKRERAYPVVGTSGTAPADYHEVGYPAPLLLLMGSERLGLSSEQQAACDLTVSIPMVGRADSLNLAVATAVMLYEIFNQRRGPVSRQAGQTYGNPEVNDRG